MAFEGFLLQSRQARPWDLGSGAVLAFVLSAPLFILAPQIDTRAAALFYTADGQFAGNSFAIVAVVRDVFKLVYVIACSVALVGAMCAWITRSRFLFLTRWQHLFLIACLAVGPGVMTNLTFKDHWGRARPREIVEFGGDKAFTPALVPAAQCKLNCSFVSGEASSMFMVFFAAALLFPGYAGVLTIAGIAAGFGAGAIRMAQGGHFLSDVVFSGILMALTAAFIHQIFSSFAFGGAREVQ